MITNRVVLERIDDNIEEEVLLKINGNSITCFACIWPDNIQTGEKYDVIFYILVFDDFNVCEVDESTPPAMIQKGDSFEYTLTGRLSGNVLDCGIKIEDDDFWDEFAYLDGKMVKITVDRINVEFLSNTSNHIVSKNSVP